MQDAPVKPQILTATTSLEIKYPQAHKFQDLQQKAFWGAEEVRLEKDVQYIHTELTEAEKHGILTVLKLFTLYERKADEFWSDVIKQLFPRPEIQEMASLYSAMELSVHRRVYDKLNQLLSVSSDAFYESYKQSENMKNRMDYLDHFLSDDSLHPLTRIAAFTFTEGVVLFSSFAFLMSFRANGNYKLPNIGLAVKFSAQDENLHAMSSAWLFRTLKAEMKEQGQNTGFANRAIKNIAEKIRGHEQEIMKEVFSKGSIAGITYEQMETYIDSRINLVLSWLEVEPLYEVNQNPIGDWFDKLFNAYQFNDFFAGQGSSYSRGWNPEQFTWKTK